MRPMIELYPQRYQNIPEFKKVQEALDVWNHKLWEDKEDFFLQLNVETATWGLSAWEEMLGIQTHSGSYTERRERVLSKLRRMGTMTLGAIKNIAESFVEDGVVVTEYPAEYHFDIAFMGKGIPKRIVDLTNVIEEMKPAHLTYQLVYQFFTHAERSTYTHEQLGHYTHMQIREEILDG